MLRISGRDTLSRFFRVNTSPEYSAIYIADCRCRGVAGGCLFNGSFKWMQTFTSLHTSKCGADPLFALVSFEFLGIPRIDRQRTMLTS